MYFPAWKSTASPPSSGSQYFPKHFQNAPKTHQIITGQKAAGGNFKTKWMSRGMDLDLNGVSKNTTHIQHFSPFHTCSHQWSYRNLKCPQIQTASFSISCSTICEQNDPPDLNKPSEYLKDKMETRIQVCQRCGAMNCFCYRTGNTWWHSITETVHAGSQSRTSAR